MSMVEQLVAIERNLYLTLNSPHTPYLDSVMYIISEKWIWGIYLLFFIFFLSYRQRPREVITLLVIIGVAVFFSDQLSSGIIKPLFQRARPSYHVLTADDVRLVLGDRGGGYGFISGHTMNFMTFITFTALLFRNKRYSLIGYIVAATVMYSRIYLGMHFITDVIPAIIIGGLLAWLLYILYTRSRVAFLGISEDMAKRCYIVPRSQVKVFPISLGVIYLFIWTVSPLIFKAFYLD